MNYHTAGRRPCQGQPMETENCQGRMKMVWQSWSVKCQRAYLRVSTTLLPDKCITTSGDQPNTPCIFPWKYKDEPPLYNGCANPSGYSGGHWCPTGLTDGRFIGGSGKWGLCDMTLSACSNGKVEEFLSKRMHI